MAKIHEFEKLMRSFAVRKAPIAGPARFGSEVLAHQEAAEAELPALVAASGLYMWRPGDAIPRRGRRVLLGVGAWSRPDLRLLDALSGAVLAGQTGGDRIDIFQFWRECRSQEQFERFIPGMDITSVFHSPVIGVWEDGILTEKASGAEGRRLLVDLYGLPPDVDDEDTGPSSR